MNEPTSHAREDAASRGGAGHAKPIDVAGWNHKDQNRFDAKWVEDPGPGSTLDHLCRVRRCVNPDHLEPVTQQVNVLRGEGVAARNAAKATCRNGHPLDGDNLVESHAKDGRRDCRRCDRVRQRERAAAVSAAAKYVGCPLSEYIKEFGQSAKMANAVLAGDYDGRAKPCYPTGPPPGRGNIAV